MQTVLTSKGQMTLPMPARRRLNLDVGDRLEVRVLDDETITLRRLPTPAAAPLLGLMRRPQVALSIDEMNEGVSRHLLQKHRPGK